MALPKSLLLIITGSVASYKSLELIRLLKAEGVEVHAILTKGGSQFITPMAVSSLTGTQTYSDLFSLTDEIEMGHIELSRIADIVLVAPASADIMAKMAAGVADDLATTALLATNKPVAIAPAMNHKMWWHAATQRNLAQLKEDGIAVIDPTEGSMACGEVGVGRLAEPTTIIEFLRNYKAPASLLKPDFSARRSLPLKGKRAIVTSGPTQEPIDPVRYMGNHSSGKQGHAIAAALANAGAEVTLVSGPVELAAPANVTLVSIVTGEDMLKAVEAALPADLFVGAAAVADWRATKVAEQKIKKQPALDVLTLEFVPTDDILGTVARHEQRPTLVVGFAAETEKVGEHAKTKRDRKKADWILANDVSQGQVFGEDENEVILITPEGDEQLPRMRKDALAEALVERISKFFETKEKKKKVL